MERDKINLLVERIQTARKALADVAFEVVHSVGLDNVMAAEPRAPIRQLVLRLSKAQDQLRRAEKEAGRVVVGLA